MRGPLTAKVLGLDEKLIVSDGAMLLSQVPGSIRCRRANATASSSCRITTRSIPAHGTRSARAPGSNISIRAPTAARRLQRIRSAKLVVADAMHAAITADALRVPWVPVTTSREISTFKWLDWTASLDMPYEPIALPQSTTAEAVRSATLPFYAYDFALDDHSVPGALAHYRRDRARKAARSWPLRRNVGHGIYKHGLLPLRAGLARSAGCGAVSTSAVMDRATEASAAGSGGAVLSQQPTRTGSARWASLMLRLETTVRSHAQV